MKLTQNQIEKVCSQTSLQPVQDNGQTGELLQKHFGEHTFFVDASGLFIMEQFPPNEEATPEKAAAILIAEWDTKTGDGQHQLRTTEPQVTNTVVELVDA